MYIHTQFLGYPIANDTQYGGSYGAPLAYRTNRQPQPEEQQPQLQPQQDQQKQQQEQQQQQQQQQQQPHPQQEHHYQQSTANNPTLIFGPSPLPLSHRTTPHSHVLLLPQPQSHARTQEAHSIPCSSSAGTRGDAAGAGVTTSDKDEQQHSSLRLVQQGCLPGNELEQDQQQQQQQQPHLHGHSCHQQQQQSHQDFQGLPATEGAAALRHGECKGELTSSLHQEHHTTEGEAAGSKPKRQRCSLQPCTYAEHRTHAEPDGTATASQGVECTHGAAHTHGATHAQGNLHTTQQPAITAAGGVAEAEHAGWPLCELLLTPAAQ